MILIDTHERKSLEPLIDAFPNADISQLKIGDFLFTDDKIVVEIKIDQDGHDYGRAGHELTNMNLEKYDKLKKHLIYVADHPYAFHEFKILNGMCQKSNVYCHHVYLLKCPDYKDPRYEGKYTDLPKKIQQLRQPAYNRALQIGEHSKELGQLGKIIETFPGMGKRAGEIEAYIKNEGVCLAIAAKEIMGVNKDRTDRKVVADMLTFLQEFKGLI